MRLTHLDENSQVNMVDITGKKMTQREAIAEGFIILKKETLDLILNDKIAKGNVFTTAKLAGINGAKKTSDLIFLTHPLNLAVVNIEVEIIDNRIRLIAIAKTDYATGIEMEALTAVSVAALNIYDMCKGVDKSIEISDIRLVKKTGGKSGTYEREN